MKERKNKKKRRNKPEKKTQREILGEKDWLKRSSVFVLFYDSVVSLSFLFIGDCLRKRRERAWVQFSTSFSFYGIIVVTFSSPCLLYSCHLPHHFSIKMHSRTLSVLLQLLIVLPGFLIRGFVPSKELLLSLGFVASSCIRDSRRGWIFS